MENSPFGKIDFLITQIKNMPGETHEVRQAAYADVIETRIHELPSGEEWTQLMKLLGLLRGGLRRFEQDFDLNYLLPARPQQQMAA